MEKGAGVHEAVCPHGVRERPSWSQSCTHPPAPSPCDRSISSPQGPERLCSTRNWFHLVPPGIGSGAEQRLKQPTPFRGCSGPHSRASPLFSWERQTVPPGSQEAEQMLGLVPKPSLLGFDHFPILSHFPGSPKSWATKSEATADFLAVGVGNTPPSFTLRVAEALGQSWARGPVPSCLAGSFSPDVVDTAPHASQE